jgi:hypothetical protein
VNNGRGFLVQLLPRLPAAFQVLIASKKPIAQGKFWLPIASFLLRVFWGIQGFGGRIFSGAGLGQYRI